MFWMPRDDPLHSRTMVSGSLANKPYAIVTISIVHFAQSFPLLVGRDMGTVACGLQVSVPQYRANNSNVYPRPDQSGRCLVP